MWEPGQRQGLQRWHFNKLARLRDGADEDVARLGLLVSRHIAQREHDGEGEDVAMLDRGVGDACGVKYSYTLEAIARERTDPCAEPDGLWAKWMRRR